MKAIIAATMLTAFTFGNNTETEANPTFKKKLSNISKVDLSEIKFYNNTPHFVRVEFIVNKDKTIKITETNASNKKIERQVLKEINTIKNASDLETGKVYNYNFTFEKR